MKELAERKLVQENSIWEVKAGKEAKLWDKSWNQFLKLGNGSTWKHIRARGMAEGRTKVYHYWEEGNQEHQR